jgi:predicted small integral membrane protein
VLLAALAFLVWATPRSEDGIAWTDPMIPGGWMAWTFPTALFFWCIASILALFTILAIRFPETPRRGILRIETTRGDRLFITLLGSAFIHLATLGFLGPDLIWVGPILSLIYAAAVFRWV